MIRIPRNDAVYVRSDRRSHHYRIFIIAITYYESLLAVDSKRVDDLKDRKQSGNDIPGLLVNILLSPEYLTRKKMNIAGLF